MYNNKYSLGDQVHAHNTNSSIKEKRLISSPIKENGNTRKFFHVGNNDYNEKNYLILHIDKILDKKELNINLRFLTDTGIERIKQLKINFDKIIHIVDINQTFEGYKNIINKCGVVQVESYDHNINGSMITVNNENIAVDHLTGG